eukprot:2099512-Amphidinium_carterae.1
MHSPVLHVSTSMLVTFKTRLCLETITNPRLGLSASACFALTGRRPPSAACSRSATTLGSRPASAASKLGDSEYRPIAPPTK